MFGKCGITRSSPRSPVSGDQIAPSSTRGACDSGKFDRRAGQTVWADRYPNHGPARRIIAVASASRMPSTRAMPAITDHEAAGGIHGTSQEGTWSRKGGDFSPLALPSGIEPLSPP